MKDKKRPAPVSYNNLTSDDIRTIPDFYDNLYPSFDNFISHSIINVPAKNLKNREKKTNSKK